jgi:hypothetical protein
MISAYRHVQLLLLSVLFACLITPPPVSAADTNQHKLPAATASRDTDKLYERVGLSLSCSPSPNGTDYVCYRKIEGAKPTTIGRIGRWLFRLYRDPIAVFTFALLCVGVYQVGIAQKTAHRQLRAYVIALPGAFLAQDHATNLRFDAKPLLKNVGQTPAYNVRYNAVLRVLPQPLPDQFNFELANNFASISSKTTIGSGQENFMHKYLEGFLSDEDIIAIIAPGGSKLCFYGEATYTDIFNKHHKTEFCWHFVWDGINNPLWLSGNQNNRAD